jgi:hypothetical protein
LGFIIKTGFEEGEIMEKKIVVAPVDEDTKAEVLFATLKEFPTKKMILLSSLQGIVKAEEYKAELGKLGIDSTVVKVDGENLWEAYFMSAVDVCQDLPKEDIVFNISTSNRIAQCSITNAAHVNGLRAVAIINGQMMMLPILKISFSNVLSEKKMKILKALDGSCIESLEDISKKTSMSLQLVSYHINGTPKSIGLSGLELIETKNKKGKVKVCLSTMGKLFMRGYLKSDGS